MTETTSDNVVLAKLQPSNQLLGVSGRFDIEPLYDSPTGPNAFALDAGPQWFKVRLDDAASPWDQAHSQVAAQLGIAPSEVLFAEPDIVHSIFAESDADGSIVSDEAGGFHIGESCTPIDQENRHGKAVGTGFAWHLGDSYTELAKARSMVEFAPPETRIAHIDTGFYPEHEATPHNINQSLQRNFVERDHERDAEDPGKTGLVDNSGHGTGTIGILAAGAVPQFDNAVLGGAPDAEVVPIRVAKSVILLRTSALARALRHAVDSGCAVATMSMGGLPTSAWAEAVDDAYLAGLLLCAAGGNRKGSTPPKTLVYPARYDRVLAVTGAMADNEPYKDLTGMALEGSFGPKSVMKHAIAAYTPNIPWPKFGCSTITRLNGEGTSSATPQVAAAAALWIELNKGTLRADWQRVEAVRHALYTTAKKKSNKAHFGNGILQAAKALAVAPNFSIPQAPRSKNSWAFLRLATGLGIQEMTPQEEMFNLELAQLWLLDESLQQIVADPDGTDELPKKHLEDFMESVLANPSASRALRDHLTSRYHIVAGAAPKVSRTMRSPMPDVSDDEPEVADPPSRRLRVYSKDPSLTTQLATSSVSEVTLEVPWERLSRRGHSFWGEYIRIDDKKPGGGGYSAVDLDDSRLLATDGWQPSEGNPQFHQQMVYGVAMKTIEHFERALGRPVQWRPRTVANRADDSNYVGQLVIKPHALQTANAYYSPEQVALLFGFYPAPVGGQQIPGSPVYTCLAHDIVVHETTHAVLDGMYRRFNEPSNVDVLAFHEGFADIVALLQQFSMSELLYNEIMHSGGNLEAETMLGRLAIQLGQTTHGNGALRSAIGSLGDDGTWIRATPDPTALRTTTTPHARGAILVGAVFDALLAIYRSRTADLVRIATGGTGVLPAGAIHPDLAHRLAGEASKTARHVLNMCIRALDFLPPVDVTFFDYLRALVTADYELEAADRYDYRVAFVEAFARRGIFPGEHDEQITDGPRALSADTLRWPSFDHLSDKARSEVASTYAAIIARLKSYADDCLYIADREQLFQLTRNHRAALHAMLRGAFDKEPEFAASLGLAPGSFEVHTLRRAMRVTPDGRVAPQVIVSLTQSRELPGKPGHRFRGGSTLVVDLTKPEVPKYRIVKHIDDAKRLRAAGEFATHIGDDPLRRLFLDAHEPFAALHQLADG